MGEMEEMASGRDGERDRDGDGSGGNRRRADTVGGENLAMVTPESVRRPGRINLLYPSTFLSLSPPQ